MKRKASPCDGQMSPLVQVYIMSHDRPAYALACVRSALAIDHHDFQVILSDNSSPGDDRTRHAVNAIKDRRFVYKRRAGTPAIEHANLVIEEASAAYFTMFHDDDLFLPSYLKAALRAMSLVPGIVAAGVNHYVMFGDKKTSLTWSDDSDAHTLWTDPKALLLRMATNGFHTKIGGFAMLGGYLYRTKSVRSLRVQRELGGKYTDITWLTEVCKLGPVVWALKPQMHYRQHLGQDGNIIDLQDALSLLAYIKRTCKLSDKSKQIKDLRRAMVREWTEGLVRTATLNALRTTLGAMKEHVVLFPCGQYTRRVLQVIEGAVPYARVTLLDDDPSAGKGLGKWSRSFQCVKNVRHYIEGRQQAYLASDSMLISKGLRARAQELFGNRWRDIRTSTVAVEDYAMELKRITEAQP